MVTPLTHVAMFTRSRAWNPIFTFPKFSTGPAKKEGRKVQSPGSHVTRRQGEYLYGVASCTAALQSKRRKVYTIYQKQGFLERKAASKRAVLGQGNLHKIAEELKVDLKLVDTKTLDRMTGNRPHQGIVVDVAPLNYRRMDPSECKLSEKERNKKPIWILLDEIQDPMNLGAILRCSYYLGVDRVIGSLKRCCPLSPAVSKASAGAMELMPVYAVSHLENFLKEAQDNGWSIMGTTCPEEKSGGRESTSQQKTKRRKNKCPHIDCLEYSKQGPTLLVLGNEGWGLHQEVAAACEGMLTVCTHRDLSPGFDSLNVAVATGIILHCLQRQQTL